MREAMERFFEEVRALRREVEADGAAFALVVLPFRFQVEPGAPAPVVQQKIASFCATERLPLPGPSAVDRRCRSRRLRRLRPPEPERRGVRGRHALRERSSRDGGAAGPAAWGARGSLARRPGAVQGARGARLGCGARGVRDRARLLRAHGPSAALFAALADPSEFVRAPRPARSRGPS